MEWRWLAENEHERRPKGTLNCRPPGEHAEQPLYVYGRPPAGSLVQEDSDGGSLSQMLRAGRASEDCGGLRYDS
jgi:hypothetical protein